MKSAVLIFSTLLSSSVLLMACAPSDPAGGAGGQTPGSGGAVGTGGTSSGSGGATTGTGGAGTGGAITASGGAPGSGGRQNASGGAVGSGGSISTGGADPGTGGRIGGSGGRAAGTGGRNAGSGGSTGTGGGAAGGATGTATFAAVATILGNSCGTGTCHQGTAHTDLRNNAGLHARIVGGMPMGTMVEDTCVNRTLVVPSNTAMSIISLIIKPGGVSGCGPRMPNQCSATGTNPRPCLTTAQIATIDAWIAAGANP